MASAICLVRAARKIITGLRLEEGSAFKPLWICLCLKNSLITMKILSSTPYHAMLSLTKYHKGVTRLISIESQLKKIVVVIVVVIGVVVVVHVVVVDPRNLPLKLG